MRSKLKEDNFGQPDQEFNNFLFEAFLNPKKQKLHLKIVSVAGRDDGMDKLPMQLISQSRLRVFEEEACADANPTELRSKNAERTPQSRNWIGTDSVELSQRIVQTMMSRPLPHDMLNLKLAELPPAKIKDIESIAILVDKSLYDRVNEQKPRSNQNSSRPSELLNTHIIQEEDDSASSHLSNHLVSINRKDIKLSKEQSYSSFLSQGPPKSYTALSKFNRRERNQQSELIPNQQELSLVQKPKIMVSSQDYMISNDGASGQISSHDRVSVRKSRPLNQVDQKLSDIKAGTFVPEVEDVVPYDFGGSDSD